MAEEIHVVLGGAGALGSAIVRKLTAEGKLVRAVVRDAEWARPLIAPEAGLRLADAASAGSVRSACEGATILYHCVNVRHSQWKKLMPGITDNIVAAARAIGARLVFPGNVYGYGPLQHVPATEDHPLAATSGKGQLRNALEARLLQAHRAGEVSVVLPRFPDYYGPNVTNPLVAPIFRAVLEGKAAAWPISLDIPHDLVYIEDAATACILLAATESAYGQVWHVPGAGPLTGRQFLELAYKAASTEPRGKALSRLLFRFFGMLIPDAGEMVELLYQFEQPLVLDGSKFAREFPSFQYTPHEEAVRRTVEWFREQFSPPDQPKPR